MRCEDIMNRHVRSLREHDTALIAAQCMRDQRAGFLPICSESGMLLGTITDRDIVVLLAAADLPLSTPVKQLMNREPIACLATDDVRRAELLMQHHRRSRVVCTDEDGHTVGVLSLSDIARHETGGHFSKLMKQIANKEAHRTSP